MNMTKEYTRYETYSYKGDWQASYNSQLGQSNAFIFASDCAEYCGGQVIGVRPDGELEVAYTAKNFGQPRSRRAK